MIKQITEIDLKEGRDYLCAEVWKCRTVDWKILRYNQGFLTGFYSNYSIHQFWDYITNSYLIFELPKKL